MELNLKVLCKIRVAVFDYIRETLFEVIIDVKFTISHEIQIPYIMSLKEERS